MVLIGGRKRFAVTAEPFVVAPVKLTAHHPASFLAGSSCSPVLGLARVSPGVNG